MDGEDTVQRVIESHVKPGSTFIDIGANFGLHTMLAAHYAGESGKVYAFEPVPANNSLLRRNLVLNGFSDRCEVFACALAGEGGHEIEMTVEPGLSPAASLRENFHGEKIKVPVRTLDDCLPADAPIPDLVKIDVEGAEHEVLKGAVKTLRKGPDLLIEVHSFALPSFDSSPEALQEYLANFGYVEENLGQMESHLGKYYHALYRVK